MLITIRHGQTYNITPQSRAVRIRALKGRLWFTQNPIVEDVILGADTSDFVSVGEGRIVVEALDTSAEFVVAEDLG